MPKNIRVLIVDDSALVRKLLRDVISGDPGMEVIGAVSNGVEAIRAVAELKPDVVTMDIHMPEMDGLSALEYIMRKNPLPVVMLSALAQKGAAPTLKALELGAVDFITKPSHFPSAIREVSEEVILKVRTAAQARKSIMRGRTRKTQGARLAARKSFSPEKKLVIIGASAGGPKALAEIMPRFPADTPAAMIIVQHMPGIFTRSFAERLNGHCEMPVKEAEENEDLSDGRVLVVPGGCDLIVSCEEGGPGKVQLMNSQNKVGASPRIDTTMITAAEAYGSGSVGVIMTGMGSDGAGGIEKIKKTKGNTIAQNEESCLVYGMPKVAIERGYIDWIVALEKIPEKVLELL
ncbi:MAG: chemotaxis response regulator protein-glutamate methylesterase [Actinomycetota bacterium]|nr:chemotaxis response regulator protein-glutamate methylesterase [Actinomycetota bacterium]